MSDRRLRELERRWQVSKLPADEAPWLAEALRQSQLSRARLEAAAVLGHRASCLALGLALPRLLPSKALLERTNPSECAWGGPLEAERVLGARAFVALAWGLCDERYWRRREAREGAPFQALLALESTLLGPVQTQGPEALRQWGEPLRAFEGREEESFQALTEIGNWVVCPQPHHHPQPAVFSRLVRGGIRAWLGDPLEGEVQTGIRLALDSWGGPTPVELRTRVARELVPWLLSRRDPLLARVEARASSLDPPGTST